MTVVSVSTFGASSVTPGSGLSDLEGIFNTDFTGIQRFPQPRKITLCKALLEIPTEAMGVTCKDTHLSAVNSQTVKQLPLFPSEKSGRSNTSSDIYLLYKPPVL